MPSDRWTSSTTYSVEEEEVEVGEVGVLVEVRGRQTLAEGVAGATSSAGGREGIGRVKMWSEVWEMIGIEAWLHLGGGEEEKEEE